jgi:hypothetical protein
MGSITHAFAPYRSYSIHEIDGNHTICKITCGIRPDLLFSVASPPTHPELSLSFLHLYQSFFFSHQSSFSFVYAGSLRTHPQSKAAARSRGPRRRRSYAHGGGTVVRHRQVEANGISIHIAKAGPEGSLAPAVLFVHGFPELWYSWRHQIGYLAARGYRCFRLDLRDYGGTTAAASAADGAVARSSAGSRSTAGRRRFHRLLLRRLQGVGAGRPHAAALSTAWFGGRVGAGLRQRSATAWARARSLRACEIFNFRMWIEIKLNTIFSKF